MDEKIKAGLVILYSMILLFFGYWTLEFFSRWRDAHYVHPENWDVTDGIDAAFMYTLFITIILLIGFIVVLYRFYSKKIQKTVRKVLSGSHQGVN